MKLLLHLSLVAVLLAGSGVLENSTRQQLRAGEPTAIKINYDPQFLVDDTLIDNRWGIKYQQESITRVVHAPQKSELNPVIAGKGGYVNVARDSKTGKFRMWYQDYWDQSLNPRKYTYATAYAESEDGLHWSLPRIGKHLYKDTRDNNIVMLGPGGGRAECQFLLDLPPQHRRGYQYVMLYGTDDPGKRGLHLIGSQDGIDWDPASDVRITPNFTPDTQNSIVWDPRTKTFVCFTRATNIYREGGQRRKVARMEHTDLWSEWPVFPENIILPDEVDVRSGHWKFYGMPTRYYAGFYWGFLWPYRPEQDIYTELVFSRDGKRFERFPERPRLIDVGPDNSWDRGMVFASPGWIEMENEWWIYYSGTDGPHSGNNLTPGIGMARLRKEGFVSLHSPAGGGVIVTRLLTWPGGDLCLNANVIEGDLTVRITDYDRRAIPGFERSLAVTGDRIRHEVKWDQGELNQLRGKSIRFEFQMSNVADLYAFCAVPKGEKP